MSSTPNIENKNSGDSHPWPYLESFFKYNKNVGNSVKLQCLLCLPKIAEVTAYINSPSNLKKHIGRVHPDKLLQYSSLTSQARKRKVIKIESEDTNPNKEPKIYPTLHSKVDELVINFITSGLHPFSIVETEGFCNLVKGIQPGYTMISRPTVSKKIHEAALDVKSKLIAAMCKAEHVATTTDCWVCRRRSYIGVTAHWIDVSTFERLSGVLACRQVKGKHCYNILASTLYEIHSEYKIQNKVVKTTTDNGSNFLKAFRIYGSDKIQSEEDVHEQSEDDESDGPEIITQDTTNILSSNEDESYEYRLPKHQCCACHLLNLVATVDVDLGKIESSEPYKRIFRSTFAKCHALWSIVGRSSVAVKTVEEHCKIQLIRPNATKWNSIFLAVERILKIVQKEGEDAIKNVCAAFEVKMLNPVELDFLKEYYTAMKPVAKSLDILQSEKNTHMGMLLPTLYQLLIKLEKIKTSADLSLPLITGLLSAIRHRFAEMLEDPELIAAAILLPKFKNIWTDDGNIISKGLAYINLCLEKKSSVTEEVFDASNSSSDDEDFFSSLKTKSQPGVTQEIDRYLSCPGSDIEILRCFPALWDISLKLNTPLPASAACERLFNSTGLIFAPKHSRLDSQNFENQLLVKLNKKYVSN